MANKLRKFYDKNKKKLNKYQEDRRQNYIKKETAAIAKLKLQREKEEETAKIRESRIKQENAIKKARSRGIRKPTKSSGGGMFGDMGFGAGGSGDLGLGAAIGGSSKSSDSMFDMGFGGSKPKKKKSKKRSKKKKSKKKRSVTITYN